MTYIIHIIHIIHISSPTVNDRQSPAVQLGKDFQKKSGLQRSNGHKWWWLVDMMSARSVFHSKVWRFNFSANQTAVLPGLAILPLTVVLLQTGISSFHYILFPLHLLSITSSFHFSSFYLLGNERGGALTLWILSQPRYTGNLRELLIALFILFCRLEWVPSVAFFVLLN